jgi:hypothetical protein
VTTALGDAARQPICPKQLGRLTVTQRGFEALNAATIATNQVGGRQAWLSAEPGATPPNASRQALRRDLPDSTGAANSLPLQLQRQTQISQSEFSVIKKWSTDPQMS